MIFNTMIAISITIWSSSSLMIHLPVKTRAIAANVAARGWLVFMLHSLNSWQRFAEGCHIHS